MDVLGTMRRLKLHSSARVREMDMLFLDTSLWESFSSSEGNLKATSKQKIYSVNKQSKFSNNLKLICGSVRIILAEINRRI